MKNSRINSFDLYIENKIGIINFNKLDKNQQRLWKNRYHSNISIKKKKQYVLNLEEQIECLKNENKSLKIENESLKNKINMLNEDDSHFNNMLLKMFD